jgi:L-2-hydroxyglutarate oxidase
MKRDFIVIGAGIVGLATARQLQERCPRARILLLEKEDGPARHQTGHNSGVIHAGVYYEPGSLKARFCHQGLQATYAFCREHGIPAERTGKLLVVSGEAEMERARALLERCRENGLQPEWLEENQLHELEPALSGIAAIHVRESGITDFRAICAAMLEQFRARGGSAVCGSEVAAIDEDAGCVHLLAGGREYTADRMVVCGGLMSDRLARMQGLATGFRIVPYRGEYYRLSARMGTLVRRLVYPIPDPGLPFLGVHLTRMIDGSVTVGPNAVQGWKREGYGRFNFSVRDTLSLLGFSGFWRVSARHLRTGLAEMRDSLWKRGYLERVRRYCPRIGLDDLLPYPAGIRAQAVLRDGTLLHDFLIEETPRSLHVCNAPSPAATSAIPIARHLCERLFD